VVFVCGESRGMDARFAAYFLFPPRAIFLSVAGTDRGAHAPEIFFVHSAWPSCSAHGEPPVCSVGPNVRMAVSSTINPYRILLFLEESDQDFLFIR
jgi:hypothetical protein